MLPVACAASLPVLQGYRAGVLSCILRKPMPAKLPTVGQPHSLRGHVVMGMSVRNCAYLHSALPCGRHSAGD